MSLLFARHRTVLDLRLNFLLRAPIGKERSPASEVEYAIPLRATAERATTSQQHYNS